MNVLKKGVIMFTDKPTDPEYQSVEAFVEYLIDVEGEVVFNHLQLGVLSDALGKTRKELCKELEGWGLSLVERAKEENFRTFSSNPHDRWYGPGASRTHGGSGWAQISGFAGQEG
jgi:hypothetical protein